MARETNCERQRNLLTLLAVCCLHALRFRDLNSLEHSIRCARKSYAAALRDAAHLSFSVYDVQEFERRTMAVESALLKLERQYQLLKRLPRRLRPA
jgi:lactam utilization protein B